MLGSRSSFARRLLTWYDRCKRDLPWRPCPRTGRRPGPYHVLVSEAMLQQTQVATVIPYYNRFVERFPAFADLAAAEEQDVLRLWQGLGYYSRARNLRAAARVVTSELGGELPRGVDALRALPGVGRYTAGAVASIAFGTRAPIVDGNVARVLCRVDRIEADPRDRETSELLWRRAEEILPGKRVGDFNSALMELGATVCTPRSPLCLTCPVREHCAAFAAGIQERIPAPRKAKLTPLLRRVTFCIRRPGPPAGDEWLIEQRPAKGRWAGMWQFVTTAADAVEGAGNGWADQLGGFATRVSEPRKVGVVTHALTHRRYEFDVYACDAVGGEAAENNPTGAPRRRQWSSLAGLAAYPLPRPHVKIAAMLEKL